MQVITTVTTITTITTILDDGTTTTETKSETITNTETTNTTTTKTAKAVKTQTSPENSAKITTYEQFKQVCLETYNRLNVEFNLGHLVHIYRLRRDIGDRVTRTQFNNWLLEMQSEDIFQLMAGEMPDITPDKREDSLTLPMIGAFRYYAQKL